MKLLTAFEFLQWPLKCFYDYREKHRGIRRCPVIVKAIANDSKTSRKYFKNVMINKRNFLFAFIFLSFYSSSPYPALSPDFNP